VNPGSPYVLHFFFEIEPEPRLRDNGHGFIGVHPWQVSLFQRSAKALDRIKKYTLIASFCGYD
jgi:hypothetical protein